jgi:hypothetical protein
MQHMADLMESSNIMEICCGVHRPEGLALGTGGAVFINKCIELGVVPNSKALEMLGVVRGALLAKRLKRAWFLFSFFCFVACFRLLWAMLPLLSWR